MKPRSTSDPTAIDTGPLSPELEEQIRARAYEIYEQRGRDGGHQIDDWLQAEAELSGKSETAAA
jgi:DUF2934 family protein